jgi:hypothetical protein
LSAPQTNIEKQKKRHRGPLISMAFVVMVAVPLFLLWFAPEEEEGVDPEMVEPLPTEGTTPPTEGVAPPTEGTPAPPTEGTTPPPPAP